MKVASILANTLGKYRLLIQTREIQFGNLQPNYGCIKATVNICVCKMCALLSFLIVFFINSATAVNIPREHIPPNNQWLIANLQEVGYYRVNYDEHNWRLLIQQLNDDHNMIHTINRAQILDDALDLARAGYLDYHIALNTTEYLRKESEYVPFEAALNGFSFLDRMLQRSASYGHWKVTEAKQKCFSHDYYLN